MGVDFALIRGLGILFPVDQLSEQQRYDIYETLDGSGVSFAAQDNYGNLGTDFTAYAFISLDEKTQSIFDSKIGHTPCSLMTVGVYQENDYIKGGAVRPFAINTSVDMDALDDEESDARDKIIELVSAIDAPLANILETKGVFGNWLFSYFH